MKLNNRLLSLIYLQSRTVPSCLASFGDFLWCFLTGLGKECHNLEGIRNYRRDGFIIFGKRATWDTLIVEHGTHMVSKL